MNQQRLPNMGDGKTSGNAAGSGAEGGIVKIDNVLVCTNNDTIVIESKSKPIVEELGHILLSIFFNFIFNFIFSNPVLHITCFHIISCFVYGFIHYDFSSCIKVSQ